MAERTEDAQTQALRAFLLLCALESAPDAWPGRLVLVRGLESEGRAVSVAATIAGAACLAIDARAEVCRATLRAGACDFVVNSTDEALRILKNEIRKRKPVSVVVATDEQAALEELAARGVAPYVFVLSKMDDLGIAGERFPEFGTRIVTPGDFARIAAEYTSARGLEVREFRFATAQELNDFDRKFARMGPRDELLSRWAMLAPGFFYRERPFRRATCLSPDDLGNFG